MDGINLLYSMVHNTKITVEILLYWRRKHRQSAQTSIILRAVKNTKKCKTWSYMPG